MIKTLKFGGTSVGSAQNMRMVAGIITKEKAQVTVLSAMSETTNGLVKICSESKNGIIDNSTIEYLIAKYKKCVEELLNNKEESLSKIEEVFGYITSCASSFDETKHGNILAQGELLTTFIFTQYLKELGLKAELINIPSCMVTDVDGMANTKHLEQALNSIITEDKRDTYFITQGFICTNALGILDNLGRGGSDYSAALIGAAINAQEVQIWTDIDGMHNNDPRYVEGTYPIRRMNFTEAAELAYFGAKILHPATIQPCKEKSINVSLKNTMDPDAEGTLITAEVTDNDNEMFHAVAAKDDITTIRICSARMLMAYGFLRKVFEVFEKYKTPIDMITTSEVAISLTIDNDTHLEDIVTELQGFGRVDFDRNNSIVCVVGNIHRDESGLTSRVFDSITNIPIKMISYGASSHSVAFLIDSEHKISALRQLNKKLFLQ